MQSELLPDADTRSVAEDLVRVGRRLLLSEAAPACWIDSFGIIAPDQRVDTYWGRDDVYLGAFGYENTFYGYVVSGLARGEYGWNGDGQRLLGHTTVFC